ncbi:unnamed protein product [Cylindrotheca closterium]|uniref:Uncharacterized protein n=1 Tax=Cylindrotheca closterium TaxID=2856 RepID=A0AAD2FUN9_9STRA|nr:unnamed protein product [Cylindrotheca closterium]
MTVEMTTAHFDDTLETVLSASFCGIVFCAMWLIFILVDIEASKVSFFTVDVSGKDMDLQLDVTTDDANSGNNNDNNNNNGTEAESEPQSKSEPEIKARRGRRVSCQFKLMQAGSVLLFILLTYLLLVASNASWWLSAVGGLAVFGMFLRFQIGDEIRLQRWDRLTLMMSLLLLIAAFLNHATYAWKALAQGEIYMGPARILDYDMGAFNNTINGTTTTRTNLVVQWGSDWGCPFSGGKICEADVEGVMCAVKPGSNRRRRQTRTLVNNQAGVTHSSGGNGPGNNHHQQQQNGAGHNGNAVPQGNGTHAGWGKNNSTTTTNNNNNNEELKLENENQDLEKENEELKEEIEALKEKEDEQVDEMIDGETAVEEEMLGEQLEEDVDIINTNEEKEEALADEDEMEETMDKDEIKDELKNTNDDSVKDELEKDIDLLDEETAETEKDLDEVLDEDADLADEYEEFADEEYDEAVDEFDAEIDEMFDEEDSNTDLDEIEAELDETEEQLDEDEGSSSGGSNQNQHSEATDDWTWDDMSFEYDDDMFENEYWNYDWDSAWGEYGCGDLFETEVSGQVHDPSIPAGKDDDWPFINIYGSCKYCDAYVLDYFAEEAFERLDEYVLRGVVFMGLAFTGILISFVGFVKYKLAPPAENQIELLGSEAGVIA